MLFPCWAVLVALFGFGFGFRLSMLAKVDGAEGEEGPGAMLLDVVEGGMEMYIAVEFGFGETGFELDWRCRRRPLLVTAGGFVIREPVFPVSAATAAKEPVDGEGGFGEGEMSRCSDWEEFLGRPRRKEPRMVERRGGESLPAWGSIAAQRLPKRDVLLLRPFLYVPDRINGYALYPFSAHSGPRVPHHPCMD